MSRYVFTTLFLALGTLAFAQAPTVEIDKKGGYAEKRLAKGPKKVYIHKFEAYFQTLAFGAATSRARTIGNTRMGKTKTEMLIALEGVATADLQAATDEVYTTFVADLKAQGYEVITAADAQQQSELLADYTLREGGKISSAQLEGFARVTPTGYDYLVRWRQEGR